MAIVFLTVEVTCDVAVRGVISMDILFTGVPTRRHIRCIILGGALIPHKVLITAFLIVLTHNGVSSSSRCQLKHPELVFSVHLAVVVNLAESRSLWKSCMVGHIDVRLIIRIFFDRLVVFHLAFDILVALAVSSHLLLGQLFYHLRSLPVLVGFLLLLGSQLRDELFLFLEAL